MPPKKNSISEMCHIVFTFFPMIPIGYPAFDLGGFGGGHYFWNTPALGHKVRFCTQKSAGFSLV